jgi:hypothetical protein
VSGISQGEVQMIVFFEVMFLSKRSPTSIDAWIFGLVLEFHCPEIPTGSLQRKRLVLHGQWKVLSKSKRNPLKHKFTTTS